MPYKDPEKRKENHQKNKEERNAKKRARYQENIVEISNKNAKDYQKNKERNQTNSIIRLRYIKAYAARMLNTKVIDDQKIWHLYCNIKRQNARISKTSYSEDFTDEIMFKKMQCGCFYCGNPATTLDRLDSNLDHTPENCVGCCDPCNISKGNSDPDTFIRKAYYRIFKKYFDDDEDIWSDNMRKPQYSKAKSYAQKQGRDFTLTLEEWNMLTMGDCSYCGRVSLRGKWNGVDKIIPGNGYVMENVVSCCNDCNNDKWTCSVDDMINRNEKIVNRLNNGDIAMLGWETNLRNNGIKRYPFLHTPNI
jgi:hypothetical protein